MRISAHLTCTVMQTYQFLFYLFLNTVEWSGLTESMCFGPKVLNFSGHKGLLTFLAGTMGLGLTSVHFIVFFIHASYTTSHPTRS